VKTKKPLFFDAGGTLFDVRESVGFQYCRLARKFGVQLDADRMNRRFREAFQSQPPLAFSCVTDEALDACERRWWHDLLSTVCKPADFSDFDAFFAEAYNFFEQPEAWSLFPETMDLLIHLQKEGHPLGIISNFDSRLIPLCQKLDIAPFFKTITFSSRAGVAKPSPEIFRIALKAAAVSPGDALYVGDSPAHDIEGPQQLGMPVLLLDRAGRHPQTAVTRIESLKSVLDYV
jgi:putative hydrolase of the HAD superfamily